MHGSPRMEGFGGPAHPSPTIAQCLNGGYSWLEVKCRRCETRTSIRRFVFCLQPIDLSCGQIGAVCKNTQCSQYVSLTLNHRVPGSSPGAPTKLFKGLDGFTLSSADQDSILNGPC